jgi:hypothetical protein
MAPPPQFLDAVNKALAEGATLVGGVSTAAPSGYEGRQPTYTFAQAVLYP